MKTFSCPNCGANYNPEKYRCEYCGSYNFISDSKYEDLSTIEIKPDETGKYPGVYVFGRLLGKAEKPIVLGLANYFTGSVSAGGKLLLTNKSLSFSAHALNVGRQEANIDLKQITDVRVAANFFISQHILVTANGEEHRFVVYNGNEWVKKIKEAVEQLSKQKSENYIEELKQLKQLLDTGVISEYEFNVKKRMILGL